MSLGRQHVVVNTYMVAHGWYGGGVYSTTSGGIVIYIVPAHRDMMDPTIPDTGFNIIQSLGIKHYSYPFLSLVRL